MTVAGFHICPHCVLSWVGSMWTLVWVAVLGILCYLRIWWQQVTRRF